MMFLFLLHNWQIMPSGHIMLSAHGGVSTNGLSDFFFLNDSVELLEIMSDGRAFHSLAVVGK